MRGSDRGALALVGISARELRDGTASAADLWGPAGPTLGDRLATTRKPTRARAMIAAELLARLGRSAAADARLLHAVAVFEAACGELPVPAVAAKVGLSERQLERLFDERVGCGPKMFARVVRLQRAVASIPAQKS